MTAGGIEVWVIDLERACGGLHEAGARLGLLLGEDTAHVAHLQDGDRRRRRHAVRIALRLLLWNMAGRDVALSSLQHMPRGKPMLPGSALEISLAHTAAHALLAISGSGPVGIDIETVRRVQVAERRRRPIELAGQLLAPQGPHATAGSDECFVRAWTRIEALAKLTGAGAAATLTRLGVRQVGADAGTIAVAVAEALAQPPDGPVLEIDDLPLPQSIHAAAQLVAALARTQGAGPISIAELPRDCASLVRLAP